MEPKDSLPTKGSLTDRDHKPQLEDQNRTNLETQNIGPASADLKRGHRTAHDVKSLHNRFPELGDDVLRQITIVPEGQRLQASAVYLDLNDDPPQEFTATSEEVAGPDNLYVAKKDVAYEIWNHLIGEEKPEQEFDKSPSYRAEG